MFDSGESSLIGTGVSHRCDPFKPSVCSSETTEILRLHVLASGSKGNASAIEYAPTADFVVIDCGISCKKFLAALDDCHLELSHLKALLVTHEHTDHTKGLGVLFRSLAKRHLVVPLYVNDAVRAASKEITAIQNDIDIRPFSVHDQLSLASMQIYPFSTSHDAAASFGFRVEADGDALGFLTDSGVVDDTMHEFLCDVRILGLESNHDARMLQQGIYPYSVKQRIASDRGHLSNDQAARALSSLLSPRLQRIVALHISENNNRYRLALESLQATVDASCHHARVGCGFQNKSVSY